MTQLPERIGQILDKHHAAVHGAAKAALIAEILQAVIADYCDQVTMPALTDAVRDMPQPQVWRKP